MGFSDDHGDDKSVKKDEITRELLNFRKKTQKPMTHECYHKSIGIESVLSQHKSKKYEVRKIAYKNYVESTTISYNELYLHDQIKCTYFQEPTHRINMISPEIICQQHFSDSKNLQKSEKSAIIEWLKTLCLHKFALLNGIICYALLVIFIVLVVFAAQRCK